jgi:hypothetical protein
VGSRSSSRRQSSESTVQRASRLAFVPSAAFRTLSTAYSSLYLADLFRSAATSRISAPGFLPRPSCTTSSVAADLSPLAPRLCRRFPDDAKPRRVDLRPLFQVGIRSAAQVVKPEPSPVSRRIRLLRTLAADLASAMNGGSTLDLVAHRSSAARAGLGVSIDRQLRCSVSRSPFRSRFAACLQHPVAREKTGR